MESDDKSVCILGIVKETQTCSILYFYNNQRYFIFHCKKNIIAHNI